MNNFNKSIKMKRFFAAALSLAILLCAMPQLALAAENTVYILVDSSTWDGGTQAGGTVSAQNYTSGPLNTSWYEYQYGATAKLTASPYSGYTFDGWYATDNGSIYDATKVSANATYSFTVTSQRYYIARFTKTQTNQQFTATISANNSSWGYPSMSDGVGSWFQQGNVAPGSLIAVALGVMPGYKFVRYETTGGVTITPAPNENVYDSFIMPSANVTIKAIYEPIGAQNLQSTITVQAFPRNGGTVTGSGTYNDGKLFQITAVPNAGWKFVGWRYKNIGKPINESDIDCLDPIMSLTAAAGTYTYEAMFEEISQNQQVNISYNVEPWGSGTISSTNYVGSGVQDGEYYTYKAGTTVTLTATPQPGYTFSGWYETDGKSAFKLASTNAAYSFTATSFKLCEARFVQTQPNTITIVTVASPENGGTVTGGGTYTKDGVYTITAMPNDGWKFDSWYLNGQYVTYALTYNFYAYAPQSFMWEARFTRIDAVSPSLDSAASWAHEGITSAIEKNFVPADLQGNYSNTITRQEFCRMAVKWLEYKLEMNIDAILSEKGLSRNQNAFTDTSDPDILAAFALGITNGTGNNQFTPNGQFSREQAATMIRNTCKAAGMDVGNVASAGFADIGTASSWAVDGINFVRNTGIMNGTGNDNFSPKGIYSRQESIVTFDRIK